ncbi:MAG: SDR family NAD(P)-dependent oxidoreductase [Pseudomonadota bacterium]|nr:SDR family NAD(P)-dependent oxidoreductase [Pseudomonadota bacterium]
MAEGYRWNVVWVTGASSGIGRELATLLDHRAETVAVSARSGDLLCELAGQCRHVAPFALDVSDEAEVAQGIARIEEAHGPIDLAVLNAATWAIMEPGEIDVAAIRRGMEVNYMGVVHALAALVPRMRTRGRGHIAIVASIAGYRGLPRSAAYGPTKAALINLAETLKIELARFGITVSVVNSGFVDTPMTRDNPFPMPSLMPVQDAARQLLAGLEQERYEIIFPRGFVYVLKLLRIMPNRLYFWCLRTFVMKRRR